ILDGSVREIAGLLDDDPAAREIPAGIGEDILYVRTRGTPVNAVANLVLRIRGEGIEAGRIVDASPGVGERLVVRFAIARVEAQLLFQIPPPRLEVAIGREARELALAIFVIEAVLHDI